ncbi:MAG: putative polymerase sigma factor [Polyangiaceae bacterium]|jgi:hypothetical protein|nr:putative polymerase sigma factor [Polyangiaceae bacterium]
MTQEIWFSRGGQQVRATLDEAFAWCESWRLVADAPSAAHRGDAFWTQVHEHAKLLQGAVLASLKGSDAEALRPLFQSQTLRTFVEGSGARGNFLLFERAEECRFFLAPGALTSTTVMDGGPWLFWQGRHDQMPAGLQDVVDDAWSSSSLVTQEDLPHDAAAPTTPYSRSIPSVCEVLGTSDTPAYFELETGDQELALWSTLIGEGAVDLEQALRLCAERLRAQGLVEYQRLHQDDPVYTELEERLRTARCRSDLFDRPHSGFVRAIERDVNRLTADQWRHCLIGALDQGVRIDRHEAVRLGFENAQKTYGVNAQRLRSGGRADQALRSAINSCIRQGHLERDGAAYLVLVAPPADPTLRGLRSPKGGESPSPESSQAQRAMPPALVGEPEISEPSEPTAVEATELGVTESDAAGLAESPPSPEPRPLASLDRDVQSLPLPTRALNWAARREVATVRDLVAWLPEALESEKNVGRRTVRETREVLEALLEHSWEQAHAAIQGGALPTTHPVSAANAAEDETATDALTSGGAGGWAELAATLTEEERGISLLDIELPTRMRNYVRIERLENVGELFKLSHASLAGTANLGRKSLNDTVDAVRDFLSERSSPPVYPSFLQAWQAQLAVLDAIPRMIVTRRAGMHGERETLEELGAMLGVTRERVRQIEARVIGRLAERSRWRRSVEANLASAFGSGRALPLNLLAQDSWWAGIDQQELLLDYVVRRIFEDQLFVLEGPTGKRYLTKFGPSDFVARLQSAKSRVAKLEYPVEVSAIAEILHAEAAPLDPILFSELQHGVDELLLRDPARPDLALGYGRYRTDDVIAFLNGQPEPVRVEVLEEHCGRGSLPDEVLYFRRGVVGLKRHFPHFDDWTARLVPAALEVMQERPAGRQWLVPELHEALRDRGLVPEWLGHWHLASLLRLSGQVDYLGRLRVALKEGRQEDRLQYVELLQRIITEAGGPLPFDELLTRARVQTDIPEATATLRVGTSPFVRLDETHIGLVERDVPGGPQAVAAAIEAVGRALRESQLGLTPHQATQIVHALSETHATWSRELVTSVLRNESTIRIDRTRNIGLDEWDDVRCPTRPEFMRSEVRHAGGRLALSELIARMAALYGRAPDRGTLGVMAQQVDLTITGDTISRTASLAPDSGVERIGINLTGIPAELREMFQELVQEPLSDRASLRLQVKQHVETMADAYQVNEFVDLPGAHTLAAQCTLLLDRWESLPVSDRHLANAAVRYFVSWDDIENDLDVGGLDDDKQIMKAVLTYLGLDEPAQGALAS